MARVPTTGQVTIIDVQYGDQPHGHPWNPVAHYRNSHPLPSVWGMQKPGGAEYNDCNQRHSQERAFPRFHVPPIFRHRRNVRVGSIAFNSSVRPVDIRGGFPFLGGS